MAPGVPMLLGRSRNTGLRAMGVQKMPAKHVTVYIEELLAYALQHGLIHQDDIVYTRNALMDLLGIDEPAEEAVPFAQINPPTALTSILSPLLDYASEKGIIPENNSTQRDLFDTRIMGILTPLPSEVIRRFQETRNRYGAKAALDWFYALNQDCNYIHQDRITRNMKWVTRTQYGDLQITINLSKPEKDPNEIAAARQAPAVGYPKCVLCRENEGYPGRLNHPARQNLRLLPLELNGERWFFQFSPYVYYHQHCIILKQGHSPMRIAKDTFKQLVDFLRLFPHYFIGSNADLPIVGGSILNHEHFQGGFHQFPMDLAAPLIKLVHPDFPTVHAEIIKWPLSTLRLRSLDATPLIELAAIVLSSWQSYSDPDVEVLAKTAEPHNTITPIARHSSQGCIELDLVFRNNRTTEKYPLGIFHPHPELHHIKKENIGLIEVMGLAILPGRLSAELQMIQKILRGEHKLAEIHDESLAKHEAWIQELTSTHGTNLSPGRAREIIQAGVGEKFAQVLEHAGVFKLDDRGKAAFLRFLEHTGFTV